MTKDKTNGKEKFISVSLTECERISIFLKTTTLKIINTSSTVQPCHELGVQPHPYRLALNHHLFSFVIIPIFYNLSPLFASKNPIPEWCRVLLLAEANLTFRYPITLSVIVG